MNFKFIDTKMKELYFYTIPLKEESEVVESRVNFWASMNILAMQNMSLQQIKSA